MRALEKARFPQNIFVKGFHGIRPVIGGMPSGSGLVGGIGYVRGLESELFTVTVDGRYSMRTFAQANARVTFPTPQSGRPVRFHIYGSFQDYPGLRFFGLGNDSTRDDKAFFGQRNDIYGGGVTADVTRWVELSADFSRMAIATDPGNRDPSVETLFEIPQGALVGADTDYDVAGGSLRLNLFDIYNFPPVSCRRRSWPPPGG